MRHRLRGDVALGADAASQTPADPGPIPLVINLTPPSGGDAAWVSLKGAPAGVKISDGTNTYTFTGAPGEEVSLQGWTLSQLKITALPEDADGDITFTVTPYSQDANSATPTEWTALAEPLVVVIDALADTPSLTLGGVADANTASGNEGTAIDLPDIAASLNDPSSETLTIEISGLPTGWTLSDGTFSSTTGTTIHHLIHYRLRLLRKPKKTKAAAPIPITVRTIAPDTFIIFTTVSFLPMANNSPFVHYSIK